MIENFSRHLEKTSTWKDNVTRSRSEFSVLSPDDLETKWVLELYPNESKEEFADNLSISLFNRLDQRVTVSATKFSIVNWFKKKVKTLSLEPENIYKAFPGQGNGWGFGKFITHEMLKGLPTAMLLLSKDNLTIVCDLTLRAKKIR